MDQHTTELVANPYTIPDLEPAPASPAEKARQVVDGIAELAAGQAKVVGHAAKAAEEAPVDGDPIKQPTYLKGAPAPTSIVAKVRRQSAVVDRLASFGHKRRDLIEALVNLDRDIVETCQDGARAGLSWPEMREALASEAGGPSLMHDWAVPTVDRLYARATSDQEGPHPPLGWTPPRQRKQAR